MDEVELENKLIYENHCLPFHFFFSNPYSITHCQKQFERPSMKHSEDKAEEDSGMTALSKARTPSFNPVVVLGSQFVFSVHVCIFPSSVPRTPGLAGCMALWLYRTSYPPHIPRYDTTSLDLRQPEQPQVWSWVILEPPAKGSGPVAYKYLWILFRNQKSHLVPA